MDRCLLPPLLLLSLPRPRPHGGAAAVQPSVRPSSQSVCVLVCQTQPLLPVSQHRKSWNISGVLIFANFAPARNSWKSPRHKSAVNLSIPDDATVCLNKNRYTWSTHSSQNICKLFHLPQILGFTWSVSTATPIAAHTVDYPQGSMQNDGEGALQGHRVQSTPSLPRLSIQKFKIPTRVQLLFASHSGAP